MDKMVDEMLTSGVIEPSCGPWASPVVLVKKSDGTLRFCVDYRKLNSLTIKDAYPLPRIDETLDALSGVKWFSTMDLASGYWQVEVEPKDRHKTSFATFKGLYQFKVMPFGLCNAPGTFERLMESVLSGLQWEVCLVYLDDIIIYSQTFVEHLDRIEMALNRLRKAGLKLKASKCNLFRDEVKYLGHIVSSNGIATDPTKIECVRGCRTPVNVTEVRSFLGLCSYYRRFIKHFSDIAKPLNKLTEKGQKFNWTDECESSFQTLKLRLTESPVLAYPDPTKSFILDTDASGYGIGAVVSRVHDGVERMVAYGSRSLSKTERNYCVTRKELLAVVYFVKYYKAYLHGRSWCGPIMVH
ncbi:hypothetical protein SNE40_018316 [Patella caerulea]|uniref:Reverse transcriptase domain-containing protein n=1 Tax=Patella caerulea TaxID=87958 RepID=A0AAN8JAH8_PATCE